MNSSIDIKDGRAGEHKFLLKTLKNGLKRPKTVDNP
jgi:hypothetical protein